MKKHKPSTEQEMSNLIAEQKEKIVAHLVKRLKERPWEFGESGENIIEIIKDVTGVTITDAQKDLIGAIFFAAREQLMMLDVLSSKERHLFDFYNQYVQAFTKGEKLTVEEAGEKLGMSFTKENRIRVSQKFLLRAVGLPILTTSEKKVWDFIMNITKATGRPPILSHIENGVGISSDEIKMTLDVLRKMGFIKGDVGEVTIAFPVSMAGAIAAQAQGYITTVTLKDGRSMKVPCAIDGLGAGFAVGEQNFTVEAKDPHSGEKVKVEIREGRVDSFEPESIFVFNGRSCSNINFFTSKENLENWRAAHPDVEGEVMTLPEAFEHGKKVLGQHKH
jgi:hypothetical protein